MENILNTPHPREAPTPRTSSPTPLRLSGFLSGDTIRVEGDAGKLRFSVQLNVNKKLFPDNNFPAPDLDQISLEDSATFPCSYATPIASQPAIDEADSCGSAKEPRVATTRLRSGAISPVKYFPRVSLAAQVIASERAKPRRKKNLGVFERLLRRRSCPVRPCSSYAFFVMASWGDVNAKSCSFGETSKTLGQIWGKLPCKEKKVYEEMALKDNARYKWQSELFMSKPV